MTPATTRVPALSDNLENLLVLPTERVCARCNLTHWHSLTACPSLECTA